ncbi:hypothetical protein C7212DRAFT_348182 [Tuber magnatum]|uniref:Uncharacterized protein n=1 Tax=Tuber magnatum TaxID=42249 RepID=A0A317SDQ9_9PEZI|nr:hypothetical protein C7212DRAFT_348182 [Tuber magnatum]
MPLCKYTGWLNFANDLQRTTLWEANRLQPLALPEFPNPNVQAPSLLSLVAGRHKSMIMRKLIAPMRYPSSQARRIHIHPHLPTLNHGNPILLADCPIPGNLYITSYNSNCHEISQRSLSWGASLTVGEEPAPEFLAQGLLSRLLMPFSIVLCFFAADHGGLQGVAETMQALMDNGQGSNLCSLIAPKAFVILENDELLAYTNLIASQYLVDMLQKNRMGNITVHFLEIRVISIPSGRHEAMMEIVYPALQEMHSLRQQCRTPFSFQHFASLFKSAYDHFSCTITEPFSFINASRLQAPVAPKLSQHIAEFLQKLNPSYPIDSAISVIASGILLDSNPPGIHCFDPVEIFHTFYRDHCHDAANLLQHRFWEYAENLGCRNKPIENHVAELAGFHLPMQDFFDVAYGTSSDSRYKARGLENALQEAFGTSGNLFGHSINYTSRTKVAVMATTTEDTSACLFTNYNGPGTRSDQCGYRLARSADSSRRVAVWET